ncbi:DUF6090 family protein [Gilvibacter sediminis]|uniref:DUF6090 family protein n=1 Tax=Gilvibacter sediminis TaxID=379071 RepID=UPI002350B9A6|nr:DUF6090 family protein [Gilvibacter sediminis]MDC7999359.1 DUF6090 family protein [Gilvibacter sediminis]
MAKIFRKFRWKQIKTGKLRQYSLYAVGEILLVVIGILIALGINNRVETNKQLELEQGYLKALLTDFEINQRKLNNLINANQNNYDNSLKLIGLIGQERVEESEFAQLMVTTFSYDIHYNPNNAVLDELLNTGNLKSISSTYLRQRLTVWIAMLDDVQSQEEELAKQREKAMEILLSDQYNMRSLLDETGISTEELKLAPSPKDSAFEQLLNNNSFESRMLLFALTSRGTQLEHYLPLKEEIENIIKTLTEELED